jgi:amino acid adenylation domain-containing protein
LSEADRHRILFEWNHTQADFPNVCTHELFEQRAASNPTATAVIFEGQRLTYHELNENANKVAHYLRGRGVRPGDLVGVSLYRSPLMVIGLLGVWKAGAAYVPLDPTYPADRLAFMVEDAALHSLLVDAKAKPLFPGAGNKLICLTSDWAAIEREKQENPDSGAKPSDLAYVIYTSGSTGKPKGALIEHRGLVNYLWWAIQAYGVEEGSSAPVHSSISFDLSVTSLYPALLAGGEVELLPEDVGAQSLLANLRQAKTRSLVKITPAHLEILTQQANLNEARAMTRVFVIGGENLTAESLQFWREAAPETRLINEYGPTETVVGCCIYEVRREDPQNGSVPIGRPIANTELYVLDEMRQPVAVGTMGELYIGGVGVARGYLNRPELTQERFLPDPFSGRPGARMYKTGDLARYRNDGILEYLGRIDNQVKIRGYRIELGEIETVLAGQPKVQSCAVVVREDAPGNKLLVAYVVPRKGESLSIDELRRFLKDRIPDYMAPAQTIFLESFPLTQNGKIDRKALPSPTYENVSNPEGYIAPRTEIERAIEKIWIDLLKLDRIGIHDDIFEIGASSLMILAALSRLRSIAGEPIEMQVLFDNPTIAQLAEAIMPAQDRSPIKPLLVDSRPAPAESQVAPPASAGASAPSDKPHLIPVRFGTAGQELLGFYQPPSGFDRREYCLLCNPFGQEAVSSHRIFRIIADRLTRSGFHVLRFDYFGTGDSSGADDEGNLDFWMSDILRANDEVIRRSGCPLGSWIGLRLGANLAALASKNAAHAPKRLVFWDPILSGSAYLKELVGAHIAARSESFELRWELEPELREHISRETATEALGYPLSPDLKTQLAALALPSFLAAKTERVMLLGAKTNGDLAEIQQKLASTNMDVHVRIMESSIDWTSNQMLVDSILLPQDIRTLLTALTEE